MAIDATKKIHEEAAKTGTEVETWGIIDGGRQPVYLFEIRPKLIMQLHSMGVGGARMGTGIRFLSRRRQTLAGKHLIVCLTDGTGAYINEGHDHLFRRVRKSNCPQCQLRSPGHKGCSVEKSDRVGTEDNLFMYRNAEYQYADIGHAIDTAPANTDVRYIEFRKEPLDQLLDRFLGTNWANFSGTFLVT